jgi:hypothetical protein
MGKGSNVQKKQTAQARNLEKRGKSEEERKAAREKSVYVAACPEGVRALCPAAPLCFCLSLLALTCLSLARALCALCVSPSRSKDATAFLCQVCRQTFMSNARPPLLYQHVVAKHPAGTDPLSCFPVQLQGFDPSDPEGTKAAAAAAASSTAGAAAPKPKPVKKKDDGLDALLDAGIKKKK